MLLDAEFHEKTMGKKYSDAERDAVFVYTNFSNVSER